MLVFIAHVVTNSASACESVVLAPSTSGRRTGAVSTSSLDIHPPLHGSQTAFTTTSAVWLGQWWSRVRIPRDSDVAVMGSDGVVANRCRSQSGKACSAVMGRHCPHIQHCFVGFIVGPSSFQEGRIYVQAGFTPAIAAHDSQRCRERLGCFEFCSRRRAKTGDLVQPHVQSE